MNRINKRLTTLERHAWHINFRIISAVLSLLTVILFGIVTFTTTSTANIHAKVVHINSTATGSLDDYDVMTSLPSGRTVRVKIPVETGLNKGDTVSLNRQENRLLVLNRYTFGHVIEQPADEN